MKALAKKRELRAGLYNDKDTSENLLSGGLNSPRSPTTKRSFSGKFDAYSFKSALSDDSSIGDIESEEDECIHGAIKESEDKLSDVTDQVC